MLLKDKIRFVLRRNPQLIEKIRKIIGKKSDLEIYFKFLNQNSVFIDIGANKGQITLPISHFLNGNGEIHCFEPVHESYEELKKNITNEKPFTKIQLNNFALGDAQSEIEINIPGVDHTQASIKRHRDHSWNNEKKIKVQKTKMKTLDTYIKENEIKRVDFIKCDVEGAEMLVISGAKKLLSSCDPPILKLEIYEGWTKSFGYHPRDLIRLLEECGNYSAYHISPNGLNRVRSTDELIPGIFWEWLDFLFLPPKMMYKID